jgi:Tol biopolymer transport system component
MPLSAGTRLGPYEILSALGAGGMGEVYRARDTKLNRDVAIKVLPESLASDAERLARFSREAQVLAALNHPNIAHIHGFEESTGVPALVMEVVEGPTLADRIARGPIPIDEALPIAKQIAEALEAAHERGIIHRDLKPANIKVRDDGTVKVLDFGLAKALDTTTVLNANVTQSPTITTPAMMTGLGMALGTPAYMSPEQARGRALDRRTDVWAFGCVLHETLTGKRVFAGDTVADTLSHVLQHQPDWTALPDATPSIVRLLLRECLQKDPRHRLQHIGDARVMLEEAIAGGANGMTDRSSDGSLGRKWLPVAAAAGVVGGALGALLLRAPAPSNAPPINARLGFNLVPPVDVSDLDLPLIALSPTGTQLVYVAKRDSTDQLYLRPLDAFSSVPITGSEGASRLFFSPDAQWVAFLTGSKLKKVPVSGGTPTVICDIVGGWAANPDFMQGASWGSTGTIVFAPGIGSGLWQVPAAGGTPRQVTTTTADQNSHRWPELLPGDKAVVFAVGASAGDWDNAQIVVESLVTRERRPLVRGASPHYLPTGHLVYARAGTLMAVPFDASTLRVTGEAVPVLDGVLEASRGLAHVTLSRLGSIAYVPGGLLHRETQLVWVARDGLETPVGIPPRRYFHPRVSPDGSRMALEIEGDQAGVWVADLRRGTMSRFSTTEARNAIWSPDGARLTFEGGGTERHDLFWKRADGTGADEPLASTKAARNTPTSWAPDGSALAFAADGDLWIYRVADHAVRPFLTSSADETAAMFSPDGRWLAYVSDETGRREVYVQRYPNGGDKLQVSVDGGIEPMWSRDGRELYYRSADQMMAVAIRPGSPLAAAASVTLFADRYAHRAGVNRANYDVGLDGRFLMIKARDSEVPSAELRFITDWFAEVRQRVPVSATGARHD